MITHPLEFLDGLAALAEMLGEDPEAVLDAFLADIKEQLSSSEGQGAILFDLVSA